MNSFSVSERFFKLQLQLERLNILFRYFKSDYLNTLEKEYCESDELFLSFAFLKMELDDLLAILKNLTLDCDCLVNLAQPIDYTLETMEQLFDACLNACKVQRHKEGQAIVLYQTTYKKAYQIHKMFIHGLRECRRGHLLSQRPTYCCVCRRRLFFQRNHLYHEFFLYLLGN